MCRGGINDFGMLIMKSTYTYYYWKISWYCIFDGLSSVLHPTSSVCVNADANELMITLIFSMTFDMLIDVCAHAHLILQSHTLRWHNSFLFLLLYFIIVFYNPHCFPMRNRKEYIKWEGRYNETGRHRGRGNNNQDILDEQKL